MTYQSLNITSKSIEPSNQSNTVSLSKSTIQERIVLDELRIIETLKIRFLSNSNQNEKLKSYGVQTSIDYIESNSSLINEMIRVKTRLIILDVYKLIFDYEFSYTLVYQALLDIMVSLKMQGELGDFLKDPLTMVIYSIHESSRAKETTLDFKQLISKLNNPSNFTGIELLTKN